MANASNVSLTDQVVVVVGGSSGIGRSIGRLAAENGARVILMSRTLSKLEAAVASIEGDVQPVALDMLDPETVARTFEQIEKIDHLAVTAVADENKRRGQLAELTNDQMERSFDKLRGFFHVVRAATPRMASRGSIILTSGGSALKPPREGMSVLAAVNAAVTTFARALALELAPIRVNSITPGVVDTAV